MDEDLIGYLLNALDPEMHRQVERYLETSAEGRQRLQILREALEPLELDREVESAASPDLVWKTLERAGVVRRTLPFTRFRGGEGGRGTWRRADAFIAAGIALFVLTLLPPSLIYLRQREDIVRCGDNLRAFGSAFASYAQDHDGAVPLPEREGPLAAAGIYAPALRDAGYLKGGMRVYCPRNDQGHPQLVPSLEQLRVMDESPQYHLLRRSMGGDYAFNLGYVDDRDRFLPVRRQLGDDIAILADRPPRPTERAFFRNANSPNHGFTGQNVLFQGGNVRFLRGRHFGADDLFLNQSNMLAAGRGLSDVVLAPSEFPPFPIDNDFAP